MAYIPVTIADFKSFFVRDFPYGTDPKLAILDSDIQKALDTAGDTFNEALWSSQQQFNRAYLYLSAHRLVESLRASGSGLASQYAGNTQQKSVGNVSESYTIPPRVQANPFLAGCYTSDYGKMFVNLISLKLIGNVITVCGRTTP